MMDMGDVEAINRALNGYTDVEHLLLSRDEGSKGSDLEVRLQHNSRNGSCIVVIFRVVSRLSLREVNSFFQLLCLRVFDVRDRGWDRVCYRVEELEVGALVLECASIETIAEEKVAG